MSIRMRRLQRIIQQEARGPFLISLVLLTFVVFTREFGRIAELLIRKDTQIATVLKAVAYLMPSILIFTVPFAFLIGTLIAFSRLTADSEIVAMRAGGVSILQILMPVLKAAVIVTLLTAAFTLFLLPGANWRLRMLRTDMAIRPAYSDIKPRVFFLHFEHGAVYNIPTQTPEKITISRFDTLDVPVDFPAAEPDNGKVKRPQDKTLGELTTDLRQGSGEDRRASLVELNRRIALPLSALAFGILAVTLGIRAPRGGRGYGFILSIIVAFTYYVMFATGSSLSRAGVLPITIGVWGADASMGLLALLTLRFADHESPLAHRIFNSWPAVCVSCFFANIWESLQAALVDMRDTIERRFLRLPHIRLRIARIVDMLMARAFLLNLVITLSICLSLVCLFTFFEIIDDIFQNQVPYALVADYFFFLQPQLLVLLIPISVLIATLITFGSLEKFNQIVAFKSCGVSVYRIAMPILILGLLTSGVIFVIQEYVLPYANVRQDSLHNIIKGRPAQISQPGRHWIFGQDGRLYNYNLFSSERNSFVELAVYRLDLKNAALIEADFAQRGDWRRDGQRWLLRDGWVRNFDADLFATFSSQSFDFPERPEFFDEEVRDSSKMTFSELEHYIQDLQLGGFEVDYLKTELYKKLAFPLVSIIMTLIAVPFSLTMGRKGTLYGIGIGVILGIAYWGAFGVFDVLGSNGLLAPVLAAWGPNIVFGAGATFLLSMVRT
ncbi:MAG: LptF/LptG family permease [Acidobacteriota bacterium]